MKKIELKNTETDKVVVSGEFNSLANALEHGAKTKIDMSCLSIPGENLNTAKLYKAKLNSSNLEGARLSGSSFVLAELHDVNLQDASLKCASFVQVQAERVNLQRANCRNANFQNANLQFSNLQGADLRYADMRHARLENADLRGAKTHGTCFEDAWLSGALLDPFLVARLTVLPEGDIIVWKRCRQDVIAKLLVPAQAKRSNSTSRKCRSEYVITLELFGDLEETNTATSIRDLHTTYTVGETTRCDSWDEDRWTECSGGIHFFLTRLESERFA